MKILLIPALMLILAATVSCNNKAAEGPKLFCDTVCLKDTLKFTGTHEKQPTVFITAKNCQADTIIWSYKGMGADHKTGFTYLLGASVNINKDYIRTYFRNSDVAYVLFNDCRTGRGFQIKLPYDKSQSFSLKSSGINSLDRKFSVSDNLLVNTDRGNIYVEDMNTGKKAMMTFGEKLDIDYDAIHEFIDSVNVTNDRIWVKILSNKEWITKEKKLTETDWKDEK